MLALLQVSSICGLNESQMALLPKCRLTETLFFTDLVFRVLLFENFKLHLLQDWPGVACDIKVFTQGPVSFEQLFSFKKWNLQVIFV